MIGLTPRVETVDINAPAHSASARLLLVGFTAVAQAELRQVFEAAGELDLTCLDITHWTEAELDSFEGHPSDALILRATKSTADWVNRIRTFRAHHASLPVLVQVPRSQQGLGDTYLQEGVQETYATTSPISTVRANTPTAVTAARHCRVTAR